MEFPNVEEYVGAIFRLRSQPYKPLPLGGLQEYFGFSPISIHEMVQKLENAGLLTYIRYQGVLLTEEGENIAQALVRRHRIWERFLADTLKIPWDDTHDIAGKLEHAAPELVTERLSDFLGNPETCPHGAAIPGSSKPHNANQFSSNEKRLDLVSYPGDYRIVRFTPEQHWSLHSLHEFGIEPGSNIHVQFQSDGSRVLTIRGITCSLSFEIVKTIWVAEGPPSEAD